MGENDLGCRWIQKVKDRIPWNSLTLYGRARYIELENAGLSSWLSFEEEVKDAVEAEAKRKDAVIENLLSVAADIEPTGNAETVAKFHWAINQAKAFLKHEPVWKEPNEIFKDSP